MNIAYEKYQMLNERVKKLYYKEDNNTILKQE